MAALTAIVLTSVGALSAGESLDLKGLEQSDIDRLVGLGAIALNEPAAEAPISESKAKAENKELKAEVKNLTEALEAANKKVGELEAKVEELETENEAIKNPPVDAGQSKDTTGSDTDQ